MTNRSVPTAKSHPLVSLAVVAFNQQGFIHDSLEAAIAQTYKPLEILITDDCSTDGTVAAIERFLDNRGSGPTVTLHRNATNLGWNSWGRLINEVISRARGDLVVLAAGDDISRPDRVERLVSAWTAAGKPSGILHSAFETLSKAPKLNGEIRDDGRNYGDQTVLNLVCNDGVGILGATTAVTRDLFTRFGPLADATVFEDRVLGFRALLAGQVLYIDEPLVHYRLHSANLSGPNIYMDATRWERFCRGHRTLYQSFLADYLTMHPGETADPRILEEIEMRARQVWRTEKLVTGTRLQRAMAAWHVTARQRNWLYRASFILNATGLRKRR